MSLQLVAKINCAHCDHAWIGRVESKKGVCPKCHSINETPTHEQLARYTEMITQEMTAQ